MRNNPDIPNELYYLDENFSIGSLRKYQLKEILAAHDIPYLSSITRVDLINLFKKNIEPRRNEILQEYKQREAERLEAEAHETYGRGGRRAQRKHQSELDRLQHLLHEKDADGFTIPQTPSSRKHFNPEDSFASEDDDDVYIPKQRPIKPPKSAAKPSTSSPKPSTSTYKPKKPVVKPNGKHSKKSTHVAFNPEDSFASSAAEEEENFVPLTTQYYSEEDDHESKVERESPEEEKEEVKEVEEKVAAEDEEEEEVAVMEEEEEAVMEEEDEDEDYNADTDDTDEDEDVGQVDQEELVLLYKDQAVPPEVFVSSGYRDKRQTLAVATARFQQWKARCTRILYGLCAAYLLIGSIGLVITSIARKNNGYCNTYPKDVNQTANSNTGFFSLLPSSCIPCPDHGVCKGGELTCDGLYERKTPIYNFRHFLPIADDCVHNSALGKYIAKVERHIKYKLATEQGKATCEHLLAHPDHLPRDVPPTRVAVKDIMDDLNRSIQSHLPADKMEEILVIALSAVLEDPKVHYWETENNERYLGTDHLIQQKMAAKQKVNKMIQAVTDQLKKQYDNHAKDPAKYPSPALSASELRSSIVDIHDAKTIRDWQKVLKQMMDHPHIRRSFVEQRGDPVEYWELTA
ncbi:uncharacterized protein EV154DRAFT_252033 [Mucor mucedo]|uniref:uncharacterized protein n=1 Tax=Mucor mucedo TaxID=29922 RepID=UPI0022210223|nr:uncharacterized protein EV154DRAFT_252033 [Mucor mucedo]KAI7890420.1 hypothetical protein EV154DRAFT_252033 [Mucor mucedo]